jgi:hypothetical protein
MTHDRRALTTAAPVCPERGPVVSPGALGKSSLLLSFKKEDSSFLKKRSKKLLPVGLRVP